MATNVIVDHANVRLLAALVAAVGVAGCTLDKQDSAGSRGPSEFGRSISVTATPDRLIAGRRRRRRASRPRSATPSGKPMPRRARSQLARRRRRRDGVLVEPSPQQSTTDGQRHARRWSSRRRRRRRRTADARHAAITRRRRSGPTSTQHAGPHAPSVVQLVPPAGTLPPNRLPVPRSRSRRPIGNINQTITFDATRHDATRASRAATLCTYQWDFGDFETDSGQRRDHVVRDAGHLHGHADRDRPARRRRLPTPAA